MTLPTRFPEDPISPVIQRYLLRGSRPRGSVEDSFGWSVLDRTEQNAGGFIRATARKEHPLPVRSGEPSEERHAFAIATSLAPALSALLPGICSATIANNHN